MGGGREVREKWSECHSLPLQICKDQLLQNAFEGRMEQVLCRFIFLFLKPMRQGKIT